jgi:protein-L-isoaspartate(D-aspartate) O-methyltransferase
MTAKTPDQLRDDLVAEIRRYGTFRTDRVEAAFRAVPRHLFLSGVDLETAYAPRVVVTRRAADGTALSSASDPDLVAAMLEQAEVRPGHRVLEIGTATGINAALLAELTGPTGHVTTIEIDEDLATEARSSLTAAGYRTVEVIHGDGAAGHPDGAPYDRIVITAGAWDIAAGWWDQLASAGRIVIPLRLHGSGLTRSLALDAVAPRRLESRSALVCGFIPLRGTDAHAGRTLTLTDGVSLRLDRQDAAEEFALRAALDSPAHELWTGQTIHDDEPTGHLDLWLVTTGSRFARLAVDAAARDDRGLTPTPRWAGAAIHDGTTIAYVTLRPVTTDTDELGVTAHGPQAAALAAHLADLLHRWRKEGPSNPLLTACRTGAVDDQLPAGYQLNRPNSRLTVNWPR